MAVILKSAADTSVKQGYHGKFLEVDIDLRDFLPLDSIPAHSKIPVLTIKSCKSSDGLTVYFLYNILSSDGSAFVRRTSKVFWSYSKSLSYSGRATGKTLRAILLDAIGSQGKTIIIDAYRQHALEILALSQNPPTNVKIPARSC